MDIKLIENIELIKEFIEKTKRLHNHNKKEFLLDEKTHYSVSMTIFTIINQTIEVGEEIIDIKNFKVPLTYKEIFTILKKEKVISLEIGNKLENYVKDRNMIAHQYATFDLEKIYELAENIEIFEKFIEEILKYLK